MHFNLEDAGQPGHLYLQDNGIHLKDDKVSQPT